MSIIEVTQLRLLVKLLSAKYPAANPPKNEHTTSRTQIITISVFLSFFLLISFISAEVKSFLILLTSNVDLAEELTQETFYQAVKSIQRYNGECKMSVWLCQIAKHTYYNYLKKEKKNKHVSVEHIMQMGFYIPSNLVSPEAEVINRNTLISIHKKIHLLQEPYREIFLIRTSIHLSFKEIGEIFDKSENWARVTYYRAKTKLAEMMQADRLE